MENLMTKKDLAKHWKISERTVDQYREDGIVQACKLPIIRFNPQHIRELDGVKLEKHSLIEWKRLERELEYWKDRAKELEESIARINMIGMEVMYSKRSEEK